MREFWRQRRVLEAVPFSRSTMYDLINKGAFPHPISIAGGRAVAWDSEEIQQWMESRIRDSRSMVRVKKHGVGVQADER